MYRDLPQQVWRAELGVDESTAPRALIIHGELDSARALAVARARLEAATQPSQFIVLGRYRGTPVAVANVYGATLAADLTFIVVRAGARVVVQTGFFGGLRHEQCPDAILVPDLVVPEDGVARRFARRGAIRPSESCALREALGDFGCVAGGTLVSTGSIAAETNRLAARWARAGYAGVDLESAATVAVAQSLGARAGVVLHVIDNMVRGESFYDPRVAAGEARARRNERVGRLIERALDYAVAAATTPPVPALP